MIKKIIILVLVISIVTFSIACGKVHNGLSQVRATSATILYAEDLAEDEFVDQVDIYRSMCCPVDSESEDTPTWEPFYNAHVRINVKNGLSYRVAITKLYFVVKNYYGNGNDFVSSDIALTGQSEIPASVDGEASEANIIGIFTDVHGGNQYFPGSDEPISVYGVKNVVFYVEAMSEVGETLKFSTSFAVDFSNIDLCSNGYYSADEC